MKTWLLVLALSLSLPGWHWLLRVRTHNAAQVQGQRALQRGQPAEAAYYFGQAAAQAGRGGPGPSLLLSLAQAQARAGQLAPARATYARLLGSAVPAPLGSAARQQLAVLLARQGQPAQAIGLLRQALRLNPANAAARFDYETLSAYLAGQRLPPPPPGHPPATAEKKKPDGATPKGPAPAPDPATGGSAPSRQPQGQPGAAPNATRPQPAADGAPAPAPGPTGQPATSQPPANAGSAAGGFQPGAGQTRPLPSGRAPGRQRGLDLSGAAPGGSPPAGRGPQPGREAATEADAQLQTQRERLKAMSLSPSQAQQLLDALRASEQQYLQQQPRVRQGAAPAPGTPTW